MDNEPKLIEKEIVECIRLFMDGEPSHYYILRSGKPDMFILVFEDASGGAEIDGIYPKERLEMRFDFIDWRVF